MKISRIILLLIFCSCKLYSQKSDFYFHLNAAKGLPTTIIYNLHIDKDGRLLLATEKGLYRYNGVRFTRIACLTSINKEITDIVSNKSGRIMAHNFSGQLFELKNDSLLEIHLPEQPTEIQNIKLYENLLYLFSPKKTYKYSLLNFRLIDTFSVASRETDIVDAAINNDGIEIINLIDSTVLLRKKAIVKEIHTGRSKNIILHKNRIYLCPYNGDQSFQMIENGKVKKLVVFPFKNMPITINVNVIDNLFYLSSQNGLCVYNPESNMSKILFEGEKTTDIKKDLEGNLWVSTIGNGVFMIPKNGLKKYSSHAYTSICQGPDSTFFCGTSKGIVHQYNQHGKIIKVFEPSNNLIEASFVLYNYQSQRLYTNTSVFSLSDGLISCNSKQMVDYCKNITKDNHGNYWLAKPYALIFVKNRPELEKKSIVYELGHTNASYEKQIRNVRTRCVYFSNVTKKTYAAFVDGLYEVDGSLNVREIKTSKQKSYNPRFVTSHKNIVYIGTLNDGFYALENNQEVKHITNKNGLSGNTVLKIVPFKNTLYILTDEGIDEFDLLTNRVKRLNSVFGLNEINIRDINIVNNHLLAATDDGVIEVNQFNKKNYTPNIIIKGIYINNKILQKKLLNDIPYENRNINLKFEPITFNTNGNFVIQYKLESGENPSNYWNNLNSFTDELNFPNLQSGNYTFYIRVYLPQFNTYSKIDSIKFNINQPWYKSGWLITVLILSVSILIVSVFAVRNRIIAKKQIEELQKETLKKELAESKLIALKARMNPHFIYNVLNSIQGLIYTNKINEANHYMVKYADLTRKYLEQSAKDQISLKEEIETLSDYLELEKLRFEETFSYQIIYDRAQDINNIFMPPLLLQPFIENSVKHGLLHKNGDKEIIVMFKAENKDLTIYIKDNGIGIKKSAEINARRQNKPKSFATSAIYQKISLINRYRQKPINISLSEMEQGTLVTIQIPDIF